MRGKSLSVSNFGGFNEAGTVEISPLRQGENASAEGGGEIYSCGGSVEVEWGFTGLLELVDVKVGDWPTSEKQPPGNSALEY